MSKFVLTAQLQLQAPNNVGAVVQQIQSQLNGINVNLNIQGSAKAQQQIQQITKSTNAATTAAERMGSTFAISIRRFAAFSIATRAVGLFTSTLSDAIQTSIDFERQLIKVSQVTGKSISDLRGLTNEITSLSTGLGVSSNSLLEVTTVLAQAGLSASDTTNALNTLAKAALAPNFDSITETAEGAIAILAQFKQGVGALESQLGSINAVAGAFAVEASDLIDVIRRTGGVFKSSGGSLNELIALFTSVRATTRESAESIGTGLRTIFTRIQRPQTIEFLKQFGVELLDLEGKFVGPYEAVRRLSDGLSGLGERDITFIKIAEELGGFRQIGKVLPLLQQFATAESALNVATEANNSLSKDAATAQAALAVRIIKVREEFLALVRGITETSAFQVMANTVLNLASALIGLADALKPVLPLLTAFAAVKLVGGIGSFIGGAAKGLSSNRTFNQGGVVHKFATGGLVPGSGNSDTVPAMLTPGEFVIRKSSVAKLGASNLAAMNENKYALGGKASRKVDYEKGVGPSPFASAKSNKLGQEVYALQKNSGLSQFEFDDAKRFADANGYNMQQFKTLLVKRAQDKKNKAGLKTNTSDLLSTLRGNGETKTLSPEAEKLRVMLGGTPRKFAFGGQAREFGIAALKGNPGSISQNIPISLIRQRIASKKTLGKGNVQLANNAIRSALGLKGQDSIPIKGISDVFTNQEVGTKIDASVRQSLAGLIRGAAKNLSAATGITLNKSDTPEMKSILKKVGSASTIGSVFEGALSMLGAPFIAGNEQDPLDFPMGIGPLESAFSTLKQMPVDAKRTASSKNLKELVNKKAPLYFANFVKNSPSWLSFLTSKNQSNLEKLRGKEFDLMAYQRATGETAKAKDLLADTDRFSSRKSGNRILFTLKKNLGGIIQKFAKGGKTAPVVQKGIEAGGVGIFDSDKIAGGTNVKKALLDQIKLSKKPYQVISGPAGAGKTTLAASRFGNNFILSPSDIAKYSRFVVLSGAGKTKSGDFSEDAQSLFSGAEKITVLSPDKDRLMRQRQSRVESAMSGSLNDERSVGALQGTLKAPTDVNQDLYAKYKNVEVLSKYAKGGNVGTDTVPALLTPGEFVINRSSAQRIGYGNLNRMNKVGKFANGGVVQHFAAGGTATTTGNSGNIFGGLGSQLTIVSASLQALTSPVDENSSTFSKLTNSMLSFATTIGGAIFALEAFGLTITKDLIGKTLKSFSTGKGGLGDIIGGFTRDKTGKTTRAAGESFTQAFGNAGTRNAINQTRLEKTQQLLQLRSKKQDIIQSGKGGFQLFDVNADITKLRKSAPAKLALPQSLTGQLGTKLGGLAGQGGITGRVAGLAGQAITKVGGFGGLAGGAVGGIAGSLTALAGPLSAAATSATLISGAFNSVISSIYDYDKSLKKATEKGNVQQAGELASKKYDLESANTMRTAGATVGAVGGAVLGSFLGPLGTQLGSAIGATLGSISGTIIANVAPEFTEGVNVFFGGNTRSSVVALAEANAQAAKTSQELANAQSTTETALKDFEAGTISASQALTSIINATETANELISKNAKAVAENAGNKSTGLLSYGREAMAYISGGYVDSSNERNTRIDEENAKLIESQKNAVLQANELKKQAGLATARQLAASTISAGKAGSPEQLKANIETQLGQAGPEAIRQQRSKLLSQASQAQRSGQSDTADALISQAESLRKQADNYEKGIDNIIKEQDKLIKSLQAMDLGLRGPTSTAAAMSASLDRFAAKIEGTTLPAVSGLEFLTASVTSAGVALDKKEISTATNEVVSTLKKLGASDANIEKFKKNTAGLQEVQSRFASVAAGIKSERMQGKLTNTDEIIKTFKDRLGAGLPEEIKNIIGGIELNNTIKEQIERNDFTGIGDAIGSKAQEFLDPLKKIITDYAQAQQTLIEFTKKEIDARRNFIEALKAAEDIRMEGRGVQAKYGGQPVTIAERQASVFRKANAANITTGLSTLKSADVSALNKRTLEIGQKFIANEKALQSGAGAGTADRANLSAQQDDLKNAQKDQIQTIRELIKIQEDELNLIKEKNQLEKSSGEALISGDIMKFFKMQEAAGAQAAIASGDQGLISQFSTEALGTAAQDIKRQQDLGQETLYGRKLAGPSGLTERAFGAAISSAGVNDTRLAQAMAGTTAQEALAQQNLQGLGGALMNAGQAGAVMAATELQTAQFNVNAATINVTGTLNRGNEATAANNAQMRSRGGLIYANQGIFVPRGTDTVPAMLTPGEFVVNRAAVQRGNNLQILQSMNKGSTSSTSSQTATGMSNGGRVKYYANGAMVDQSGGGGKSGGGFGFNMESLSKFAEAITNFNTQLSDNIQKLKDTKFQISLSPTNINVNLNGTSFLENLTASIKQDLINMVGNELTQYKVGADGRIVKSGSTLPK